MKLPGAGDDVEACVDVAGSRRRWETGGYSKGSTPREEDTVERKGRRRPLGLTETTMVLDCKL